MQLTRLLVFLAAVAVLTAGGTTIIYHLVYTERLPPGSQQLPYVFSVSQEYGVDVGTDIFRLGSVKPGGRSWRTISVTEQFSSGGAGPKRMVVSAKGAGSEWLRIDPQVVDVPGEVNVSLHAPSDAGLGTYRGVLVIIPVE